MVNKEHYKAAYRIVVSTIDAPKEQLSEMLPPLMIAYFDQNFGQAKKIIRNHLPDGTWRWPAYDAFVEERDKAYYRENLTEIERCTLAEMLEFLKAPQVRALQDEFFTGKEKNKSTMIEALLANITTESRDLLTARLQKNLIAELDPPGTPDYSEMLGHLARRISSIAYDLARLEQLKESAVSTPLFFTWWKFIASGNPDMPEKCQQMNGKTYRHDDPIWTEYPQNKCFNCSCYVSATAKAPEPEPAVFRPGRKIDSSTK